MSYNLNLKVGNDTGNSEHDILINGYQICQPNVIARTRKSPNLEELDHDRFIENIENNLVINLISNEVPTGTYYIGTYALQSGQAVRSIEVGLDNNKSDSDIVFINTLAQIAGYAVKQAHEENLLEEYIKVNVDMTGALPINQYTKEKASRFISRFIGTTHTLSVETPKMSVKVEIKFDFIKILQEGVTTTFFLENAEDELFKSYNEKVEKADKNNKEIYNEKISKKYFADNERRILHIAIGEGTTEYPITIGKKFDPNFIQGSNNGVGHAIDKSLDEFTTEFGLSNYSRQKFSDVIKDKKHKFHMSAMEILEFHLEDQANDILKNAKREIERANNEIDMILVYGGGSILMRKALEKKLEEVSRRGKMKLLYIDEKYAVTIECKGLYEFTTSKLFDLIKKKEVEIKQK